MFIPNMTLAQQFCNFYLFNIYNILTGPRSDYVLGTWLYKAVRYLVFKSIFFSHIFFNFPEDSISISLLIYSYIWISCKQFFPYWFFSSSVKTVFQKFSNLHSIFFLKVLIPFSELIKTKISSFVRNFPSDLLCYKSWR